MKMPIIVVSVLLLICAKPINIAQAQQTTAIGITEIQLNTIIRNQHLTDALMIVNISGSPIRFYLAVVQDQFHINFDIQKSKTVSDNYAIWLTPRVSDGKILCTITHLRINTHSLTAHELSSPNPYLADLAGDKYCDLFLTPFLSGYGSGAHVESLTNKLGMVYLQLTGSLNPAAPPSAIVAGCKIVEYDAGDMNLRSGPGLNFDVLEVVSGDDAPVLGWQDGWVKVNYQGTVGWLWGNYVYGSEECLLNVYHPTEVWDIFQRTT